MQSGVKALRDVSAHRVDAYAAGLRKQGLATRTMINAHICSIKHLTRWAWQRGRLTADPLANVKLDLKISPADIS